MCVGIAAGAAPGTTASDVYMVGGLAYELLTAGTTPYHWLTPDRAACDLLARRRATAEDVHVPGFSMGLRGLVDKNVLETAELNGVDVPWCVRADDTAGGLERLEFLKALLAKCLHFTPVERPRVSALLTELHSLEVHELADLAVDDGATLETRLRALHDKVVVVERSTPLGGSRSPSHQGGCVHAIVAWGWGRCACATYAWLAPRTQRRSRHCSEVCFLSPSPSPHSQTHWLLACGLMRSWTGLRLVLWPYGTPCGR